MSAQEIKLQTALRIHKLLLGETFRGEDPLNTLGGFIGYLVKGAAQSYEDYQRRIGRIEGLCQALGEMSEATAEMNGTSQGEQKT